MNANSWSRRVRLPPVFSTQTNLAASFLRLALARIARREEARIVVRSVSDGFTASFVPSQSNGILQADWREEVGWQPEASFHRLLRAAQERPVDLALPSKFVLTQCIMLPAAALANLSAAIAYGLPSWSPFQADEVYLSGTVDEVHGGQAKIRLHYALRAKADPVVACLEAAGLSADRLVLGSDSNKSVTLPTPKMARLRKARRFDGALAITAISLALLLGSFRVMVLSQRLEKAENLLRLELDQSRQMESLQSAYASFVARRAVVPERRAREVGGYELLVALARQLPEGALIQTLEVGGGRGRVDLSGADSETTLKALRVIPILQNLKIEPTRGVHSIAVTFEFGRQNP